MYKTVKEELLGYQVPSLWFKRKDWIIVTENCLLLGDYSEMLLKCEEPVERLDMQNLSHDNPGQDEIKCIINLLKNNKALGEDGFIQEIYKIGGNIFTETIHRIIEEIWRNWKSGNVEMCPHTRTSQEKYRPDINNYKAIYSKLHIRYSPKSC